MIALQSMGRPEIPGYPNVTSIRLPDGFKQTLDQFLTSFQDQTGTYISRSEFMVVSTYWYIDHLLQANVETVNQITTHLKKFSQRHRGRNQKPHPESPLDPSDESVFEA